MADLQELAIEQANLARYRPGQQKGHYESYFLRANHPKKPLAFWIRYTVFSPENEPEKALGELWGMWFDGEKSSHVAVKNEFPIDQCSFNRDRFEVVMPDAKLVGDRFRGKAQAGEDRMEWNLNYGGGDTPLFLLPLKLYEGGFPKAKALVGQPMARFTGIMVVNGKEHKIKDWVGSQNHNWGTKHTDLYAWGQVAGFDNHPDSFLELGTAKLKFGPVWTPPISVIVLRLNGREYKLNTIWQGLKAKGRFSYFSWQFRSATKEITVDGTIEAEAKDFVGLNYYNPPGGIKHCLNSKIARCRVVVTLPGEPDPEVVLLTTENRAAFEILTEDRAHGVGIRV